MIKKYILLLSILSCEKAFSQDNDFASWFQAGVEFNLPKKFTLDISEQVRYNYEVADLYGFYTGLSLDYKMNKHLHTAVEYRVSPIAGKTSQRIAAVCIYKNTIGEFDWSAKTKIQYDIKPDKYESSAWRNKLSLKYDGLKTIKPYISYEVFYALSYKGNEFNTVRPEIGFDYALNKKNEINLYYLIDKTFNEADPLTLYVLGLNYLYKY